MRTFILRTQDQVDDEVLEAIAGREAEISNYDLNEENFEQLLAGMIDLPVEWPAEIAQYKGREKEAVLHLSGEAYELATQLAYRDKLEALLKTTRTERAKSIAIYEALLERLPEGERRDAAIARRIGGGSQ